MLTVWWQHLRWSQRVEMAFSPGTVRIKPTQWVMIAPEAAIPESTNEEKTQDSARFSQLRHPKTGKGCMYLFSQGNGKVHELTKFDENYRSWFIGNTVQQDGGLYIVTPVDPIFLVLPYIIKPVQCSKFVPLEDILSDSEFPEIYKVKNCQGMEQLSLVADKKGMEDIVAFRYNEEKTLTWLQTKVKRLAEKIKKQRIAVKSGQSDAYIRSMKVESNNDENLYYSHGMIADYLPEELGQKLKEHMGLKDPVIENPTLVKSEVEGPPSKKAKLEKENGPMEDYSKELKLAADGKKKKQTRAQKMLGSVDKKGMKSLTNFFSPKPK